MKVVFLQDVGTKGRMGEVREVADGFARNFLIPKMLALPATPSAIKLAEAQRQAVSTLQARTAAEIAELATSLQGKEIVLKAKAGAQGRLYGSITAADIAEGLKQVTGLEIDKRRIRLKSPIRQLGSYEAAVNLTADATPRLKITVEGE